ncbi:MAG: hypothetical protein ABH887_02370 [bacterium]
MDKETKKEFELLGRMIKEGFDSADKKNDKRFNRVETRLDNLEKGQEEMRLKLDNAAYRFELEDLEKRVRKIELKIKFEN